MQYATCPHFFPGGDMITQGFGFTKDFTKERNNGVYFRLSNYFVDSKIRCGLVHLLRNAGKTSLRSLRLCEKTIC